MVYSYKTPYIIDAKIQTGFVRLFHLSSLLTLFTFKFIYIFIILFDELDKRRYTYKRVNKNIHSIHSLYIYIYIYIHTYYHINNTPLHHTIYIYIHKKKKHTILYLQHVFSRYYNTIKPLIISPSTTKIQNGKTGKMAFLNNYIDSYQINYIIWLRNH